MVCLPFNLLRAVGLIENLAISFCVADPNHVNSMRTLASLPYLGPVSITCQKCHNFTVAGEWEHYHKLQISLNRHLHDGFRQPEAVHRLRTTSTVHACSYTTGLFDKHILLVCGGKEQP